MAKYNLAAAALLVLLNPPNSSNSPLGASHQQHFNNKNSGFYFCHAFAPPPLSSITITGYKRSSRLLQVPIRKSGVIGLNNKNDSSKNNDDNGDGDALSYQKLTVINSTNGAEKISVINPKETTSSTTTSSAINSSQQLSQNAKMRQQHNSALLSWTSQRKKSAREWSNDDEARAISHYRRVAGSTTTMQQQFGNLLNEESQMDEGEVEDVAMLLLEEPPNLVVCNEEEDHGGGGGENEDDKLKKKEEESGKNVLSLAEKRARIIANANNSLRTDGGGAVAVKKESLPKDVGILFVNGVTDDSPIAHAAADDCSNDNDDEILLNDAEKVLDIIHEAEAHLDHLGVVEKEMVEDDDGGASDVDEDAVVMTNFDAPAAIDDSKAVDDGDAVLMTKVDTPATIEAIDESKANDEKVSPAPPIIPPALNSVLDGITSMMIPSPPKTPPPSSNRTNDYNPELSAQHLSEINAKLEGTLNSQKSKLGKLRAKINSLRGELRRANREANRNVDDQVNAKLAPLREESAQQVKKANNAVENLEEQVEKLTRQLDEQTVKYEQTLEDKERIAAEYVYVAKSYMELKRSLDNNTTDWHEKLQKLTTDTQSLEERMAQYQEESAQWKKKCMEKADMLDESTAHIKELQSVMDEGMMEIRSKQENIDEIVTAATKEEKARSKDNLQRLSDEYEVLLSKKSEKIGTLRTTLRSANVKRRQVERHARNDKSAALKALRLEMSNEIDSLKASLQEKEDTISKMGESVQGVGVVADDEEKERVIAELMFLSKSFQELESSLEANKESYEDCIQSFEEEAAVKEKLILDLRKELEVAQEKIAKLEAQVSDLTAELVEERRKNENLTGVVTSLRNEMDAIRSNADGFENVISILRSEKDAYERQLAEEQDNAQSLREKKDDLEELIRKTKESLVMEKERVAKDMTEKDNRIAKIDGELAKRVKENKALKKSLKHTTNRYNSEQARVERLNAQLQRARRNLPLTNADHVNEIDMMNSHINELTESKDEYKSMLSNAESRIKVMTQQLLLSNQHVLKKKSEIARLKDELSAAVSTSTDASQGTLNDTISALTSELEELKSSASMQKAAANEKIHFMNLKLEEKEADVLNLQNRIKELVHEKEVDSANKRAATDSEVAEISELKSSIETLQLSLKDAQGKAKEKIQLKNQSLKEKENTIEKLKADMIDLQSEKDKIAEKLKDQVKRNGDNLLSHELQLKQTEERLVKENLAAMTAMEKEMKDTVYQLEMEVKTLKKKVSNGDRIGSTATLAQAKRMKDLESALQESREQKVSLLNENMKMKHRIDNLQFVQAKASKETVSSVPMKFVGEDKQKDVPPYFKEKQRPLVIRVVGNAWKKVFNRKKL